VLVDMPIMHLLCHLKWHCRFPEWAGISYMDGATCCHPSKNQLGSRVNSTKDCAHCWWWHAPLNHLNRPALASLVLLVVTLWHSRHSLKHHPIKHIRYACNVLRITLKVASHKEHPMDPISKPPFGASLKPIVCGPSRLAEKPSKAAPLGWCAPKYSQFTPSLIVWLSSRAMTRHVTHPLHSGPLRAFTSRVRG